MIHIIIALRDSIQVLKGLSNKMMLWESSQKIETSNPKLREAVSELESALQKIEEVHNQ